MEPVGDSGVSNAEQRKIAAVFPSCCQKLRECVLKDASKVLDGISIEMRYR